MGGFHFSDHLELVSLVLAGVTVVYGLWVCHCCTRRISDTHPKGRRTPSA